MAIPAVNKAQNVPIDFFGVLPDDALGQIFSRIIQSKDIHSLMLTDRHVSRLISNEGGHWRSLLGSHFPRGFEKHPNPPHPKDRYKRLKIRDNNIRENKYLPGMFIGHHSEVRKFAFHEGLLISCDYEGLIIVWDRESEKKLFSLSGQDCPVEHLSFDGRMLISIDQRGTLKFRDLKNGEKKGGNKTYQLAGPHVFFEGKHAVHEGKLFIKDAEETLKIYDLENGDEVNLLTEDDRKEVGSFTVHKGKVILNYGNGTIKVLDLKSGKELYKLTGNAGWGLTVKGDYLIANSLPGIKVWDLNLDGVEAFHNLRGGGVTFVDVRDDLLIAKFNQGSILVFDLKSRKELYTRERHPNDQIQIQEGMLILGPCGDGYITVFDLNSGTGLDTVRVQKRKNWFAVQGEILVSSGVDEDFKYSIKVFDIRSGNELYALPNCVEGEALAFHEGVLYQSTGDGDIVAYDFNKSPEEFRQERLSLLRELENAVHENLAEKGKEVFQKLDPYCQRRLRQHAFNCCGSFKIVKKAILNVQTEVLIEELLDSIRSQDQKRLSTSLRELLKIDSQNIKLYEYLSAICGHPETGEWGEPAFHGEEGYSASFEEKEKAVLKFRRQFLLIDLGLVSEDDFFRKLQCSPEDLEKVGILSEEDLRELKMTSVPAIAPLETADAEKPAQLEARKENIREFLNNLTELVDERIDESRTCIDDESGLVIHTSEVDGFLDKHSPWDLFQKQFEEKEALIVEKCHTVKELSENYSAILADVNALHDEFNALDRQHQITKLYAYTDQEGLEEKWRALNEKGIDSLAEFVQQEEGNPYLMAERKRIHHPSDKNEDLSMSDESTDSAEI